MNDSIIDFSVAYDALNEHYLAEKKVNSKKAVNLLDDYKDISSLGVTAKNEYWKILTNTQFRKMFSELDIQDQKVVVSKLNDFVGAVTFVGKWPVDTDTIKGIPYPIIELKLGTVRTGQPVRIEYFTAHDTVKNVKYMIFSAIFNHKGEQLSKKEREYSNPSYERHKKAQD